MDITTEDTQMLQLHFKPNTLREMELGIVNVENTKRFTVDNDTQCFDFVLMATNSSGQSSSDNADKTL